MGLYMPDGTLKAPTPRLHGTGHGHPPEERVSRKSRKYEPATDADDFLIPAGYVAKDPDAKPAATKPGTHERVKVTLCSSLTVGEGDGASSGLSPTREADVDTVGSRGLSEAKKTFLYDTKVKIGAEDCGEEGDAEEATEKKLLSQMKQLELSGTAGNILLPATDEAEVSPPHRASRRGFVASHLRNTSSLIFADAETAAAAEAAAAAAAGQPRPHAAGQRQPPGGTASFSVGW